MEEIDCDNLKTKFEEAVRLSRLWHNIKNLHCTYIVPIMNNISKKELEYYC